MEEIHGTSGEHHRFSIRLPRPLWIGVATVVFVGIGVGIQVYVLSYRHQSQLATVREIQRLHGEVMTRPGGPEWLRGWVGNQRMKAFEEVVEVRLHRGATDDILQYVRRLTDLRGLTKLERLWLFHTPVTKAGVAELRRALPEVVILR